MSALQIPGQCGDCRHFKAEYGEFDHTRPFTGDHGIQHMSSWEDVE